MGIRCCKIIEGEVSEGVKFLSPLWEWHEFSIRIFFCKKLEGELILCLYLEKRNIAVSTKRNEFSHQNNKFNKKYDS